MPKVSVITPIYNQANFINCAIRSLQRQSFGDWEHVNIQEAFVFDSQANWESSKWF